MSTFRTNIGSAMLITATALTVSVAAFGQDAKTSRTAIANQSDTQRSDSSFITEAAQGGLAEVELGNLALEKSSNADVKDFAQRMVTDHSKANDQLKELAAQKGIDLPREPSAKQKATKERLSKLSGDQFDKAYMSDMVKDHKTDVAAFHKESNSGRDADVKNFAAKTLPTLEDHLKQAESVAPKLQSANNSSSK